jgi:ABC-type sugar transport system ATPase subunit
VPETLLRLENVSKRFPGVQALDHVSMDILAGETHAVIGENGAGKSTLMRILAGAQIPDEGRVVFCGREAHFHSPLDAQRAGIGIVYQELSVFPNLSIAENIFGNRQPVWLGEFLNRRQLRTDAQRLMQFFALDFEPHILVRNLSMADRQIVEILRAVSANPRLLILDEPTSSLSLAEMEHLFELLKRLHEQGIAILYVSHHLQEVLNISDRITVLRDGQYEGTVPRGRVSETELVQMMVGRAVDLYKDYGPHSQAPETMLKVERLTRPGAFENVSFELHKGEILGFAGLVGSGRTELAQAIFGLRPASSGKMELLGRPFAPKVPRQAIESGLAYVPEDRKTVGLFLEMLLTDNIAAPQLRRFSHFGLLDTRQVIRVTERYMASVGIVARSAHQKAVTLSGGNQQKLLLATWLAIDPKVLIVDEPTRGIDVGAKVEIHDTLRRLADGGMSILLISSELPEVLTMSDRIAVMHEGQLAGVVARATATQEGIMSLASGIAKGVS